MLPWQCLLWVVLQLLDSLNARAPHVRRRSWLRHASGVEACPHPCPCPTPFAFPPFLLSF